jgi:integrase
MFTQQIDYFTLPNKVLTIDEIRRVLESLREDQVSKSISTRRRLWPEVIQGESILERVRQHHPSTISAWQRLIVFRLACCCGLRNKEIRLLRLRDLVLDCERPHVRVRSEATKASAHGPGHSRAVPLWWDKSTLSDLQDYVSYLRTRRGPEGEEENPFVLYDTGGRSGRGPHMGVGRSGASYKWDSSLLVLPEHRRLSIHCGRHSFCSHALVAGRTLVEVQKAAGHRWITTTQVYLHALESGADLPDIFPEQEIDW